MLIRITFAFEFEMGRTTILLISAGLFLALSSYSEGSLGGKFLFTFSYTWQHETIINACLSIETFADPFTKVDTLGRLYYVGTKFSWQNAKKHCESLGSRLVEIWTDEQYTKVIN